jgi:hypothetical protein
MVESTTRREEERSDYDTLRRAMRALERASRLLDLRRARLQQLLERLGVPPMPRERADRAG